MANLPKASSPTGYDVLIIGGGAAGLSAALTFGRLRRRVMVLDDERPRNQPAAHMNNFPGYDGVPPAVWRKQVWKELQKYPSISRQAERVIRIAKTDTGFEAVLASGASLSAQKVLLAYGIQDPLPAIPNLETLWGKTVVHCPFCHGFEFQEQATAILGDGDMVMHLSSLVLSLTSDLMVLTNGPSKLTPAQKETLLARNISLHESPILSLEHTGDQLERIVLENGESLARDLLYVAQTFPFIPKSSLGEDLGCTLTEFGWYEVDDSGRTSVPGVYAAGDIAGTYGQTVINSAAFGNTTARRMIADLIMKENGAH